MKRIVLIILAVLLTASAFAQRLTEQQAKDRVVSFLSSKQGRAFHSSARVNASELKSVSLGIDGVYGFNVDGGGYVVPAATNVWHLCWDMATMALFHTMPFPRI